MSLVAEAPDFIQVFSDGTVTRFIPPTAPASDEWSPGHNRYKSKDVTIDATKPITARIFLPDAPGKLPLLLYFHGGGFCIGSTTWLGYHTFLGNLSATAKTIILSVDYRLAPENRLPIAYEDSLSALQWLATSSEPWIQQADLSSIFLCGDSAGGNIAHHVAVECIKNDAFSIGIKGLFLIHPYFGSESRTDLEMADKSADEVAMNDMFWKLSLPEGSDRDYYGCNFETEWSPLFPTKVVVFVAELDFLKERGVMYAECLCRKGVKGVSLVEAKGESHVFHAWNPESEATSLMQQQIAGFIN